MYHYNLYLTHEQMTTLRDLSERTRLSVAEHVRRLVDLAGPLHDRILSGALLLGVQGVTSSGTVWLQAGY